MPRLIHHSVRQVVTVICIFFILLSCSRDKTSLIATVGSASISVKEFQERFNYNSIFPPEVPLSTQKELVLSSLLAEKIFSAAINPDSVSREISIAWKNTRREILIEELHLDSVERKIKISEDDLRREYKRSLTDIRIKYLAFNDSLEALHFYNQAEEVNSSFDEAARTYLDKHGYVKETIPERRIIWGNESASLENKVYGMEKGHISVPFFTKGQYYVIMNEGAIVNISTIPRDFETRRDALKEKLFRQRAEKKYREFYSRQIYPLLGKIYWKHLQPVYDELVAGAHFDSKEKNTRTLKQPIPKEIFINRKDRFAALLKMDAVRFKNGSVLSVEKILETLTFGPYVFDYSTARNFKKSFFNMIHLMIEHEVLFKKALEYGYENKQAVIQKMNEWNSYYLATEEKYNLLRGIPDKTSQEILDNYLMKESRTLNLKIYPTAYENVKLLPVGVLVRKSHFANRLVAAPVHNFMGLRLWEKHIKTLLQTPRS